MLELVKAHPCFMACCVGSLLAALAVCWIWKFGSDMEDRW